MISKILVPIDSLEHDNTLNAVKSALTISEGCGADGKPEIIFLHVLHVGSRIPMTERERMIEMKEESIQEEFESAKEMFKERNLENVRTKTVDGDPKQKILEVAEEENTDLIVIGSGKLHDRSIEGRMQKFFYGSITEAVIHGAPCSILVAKPKQELKKILVPVDSIEWDNTLTGIENAIELSKGCNIEQSPELVLMHVLHSVSGVPEDVREKKLGVERERVENEFDVIRDMAKNEGIENIQTIIKEGDPKKEKGINKEIVETAEEENADFIVLGSGKLHDESAKGKIKKFFYGSVTEKVLHETPCSVLVAMPLA